MTQALEREFWADPTLRTAQTQAQLAALNVDENEIERKRQKAGALAGAGGNVSREEPPPTTREGRNKAMVAELEAAMDQS